MAPILGIYASQISGHLFAPSGAYDSIATATVGSGGVSSVTFSSIPSTYTHLQIRGTVRTNHSGGTDGDYLKLRFNSDTGANYTSHLLLGNGSSATSAAYTSQNEIWIQRVGATGLASNIFGVFVCDLLDYANTNKNKVTRNLGGYDANGSGRIDLDSGLWVNTSAVSTITLTSGGGSALEQYSSFALYGIRGN
jgi:hypothetical protein